MMQPLFYEHVIIADYVHENVFGLFLELDFAILHSMH